MKKYLVSLLALMCTQFVFGRSIYRPRDLSAPHIEVSDDQHPRSYFLYDTHLRSEHVFDAYNAAYLQRFMLPQERLSARHNPEHQIDTARIKRVVEQLIADVLAGKREYQGVKILKNKDFNRHQKVGLLIVELIEFPLVIKLFIENAQSLVSPFGKGLEMTMVFLGGGAWRHTEGFTRFKNLEDLKNYVATNPTWRDKVVFPRKWFYLPEDPRWLTIKAVNVGEPGERIVQIPGIYAVICEKIEKHPVKTVPLETSLAFCTDVEYVMDPHVRNFMIERETEKIAIIDTEYFPWLLGFREKMQPVNSYVTWYANLAGKSLADKFATSKRDRKKRQFGGKNSAYKLYEN